MKGAEATIIIENDLVRKVRLAKSYRHPQLDKQLTKRRTRAEAKMLQRLEKLEIAAPKLLSVDEETATIEMEKIDAPMVRTLVTADSVKELGLEIGKSLAKLHMNDIIHGDLTTSNMLYKKKLFLIDFGLSYISLKDEDKAVDLHLLKQAIDSTHYQFAEGLFHIILNSYQNEFDAKNIVERFAQVQARGRNKLQT